MLLGGRRSNIQRKNLTGATQKWHEVNFMNPGSHIPWKNNCTVTFL